jgi:capsular exopolysaccharide synthesis family protein
MDHQLQDDIDKIKYDDTPRFSVSKFTLREILFKYLSYLPLFLLSIIICVGWGLLKIRYSVPVYSASANMFIKSEGGGVGQSDLIEQALFGGKRINIDNEIELLKSKKNLVKVVEKYRFNVSYYNEGSVKKTNIYKNTPFLLEPISIKDSARNYAFYVKELTDKGGMIFYSLKQPRHKGVRFEWNKPVHYIQFDFQLNLKEGYNFGSTANPDAAPYFVTWEPPINKASEIKGSLNVAPFNGKASILTLSLNATNPDFGKDILDALITEYNLQNIRDKNEVSANTIRFIDERLKVVSGELKEIQDSATEFRIRHGLFDFKDAKDNAAGGLGSALSLIEKPEHKIALKISIIDEIVGYLNKPANHSKTIPILDADGVIQLQINRYNDLVLARKLMIPDVKPNNMLLDKQSRNLEELRKNMLEALFRSRKKLQEEQFELLNNNAEVKDKQESRPKYETILQEILRQQNIKQALFTYLLQKKEEMAISSSSTVSNYQQIDPAEANYSPIEPKANEIRNLSIFIGLLIPIGIIYLRDLFNDKLTNRDDISKRTKIPIVGEISHVDVVVGNIVVNQSRSIISEQFRVMRSNIQFIVPKKETAQIFLITSSVSGEGKSFISLNLAGVLSLTGKKVALLEFDLRKMRSIKHEGEVRTDKGIVNYLIGQIDDPAEIISPIETLPNLHLFHSGPIAPNPAELIMSEAVGNFFDWLKTRYDYIVIDSAPVGLVSDSFTLSNYADATLYVARQRYTFKRQIDFLEDMRKQNKLKNISLIVNDVHMGNKYGYYGYGYGYGYGAYRYRYGYGYGYGAAYFSKNKKKMGDGYFDMPNKKKG